MLYYFIFYPDTKVYTSYIVREIGTCDNYHCLTVIRRKEVFSGSRGKFTANIGDYVFMD